MSEAATLVEIREVVVPAVEPRLRGALRRLAGRLGRGVASAADWVFGLVALVLGLSILAALPVLQFLSLGYLLEASARVARTGRLRDGLIGVRKAARVGGFVAGTFVAMAPAALVGSLADSAELIDPGGSVARAWYAGRVAVVLLTVLHVSASWLRGGRFRYFVWPIGHPFWLARAVNRGGVYAEARDAFWSFVGGLHLPRYFRIGTVGFFGTLAWLIPPAVLISSGGRFPPLGIVGALWLAIVVPFLPFLQVRYALEGRVGAFFQPRAIRDGFARAPWAFAFALLVLLIAAIPLYLLKIEMIPREAAWLPSLVFVGFLAPARLLTGWAFARSGRRERPRHWTFRNLGRLALIPAAAFYVLVVFLAQYTSWGGVSSLYEQHAFLLPVPFLNM